METEQSGPEERRRPGRPRQGDAVARHLPRDEEILKIAAEVFYNDGFEGAKLDEIARRAGIVKGSLYHYFDSKEHIYERLVDTILELMKVDERVPRGLSPDEHLATMVRRQVTLIVTHPVEV